MGPFEPLEPRRPPRSPLLSVILFALVITYALGAASFLIAWEAVRRFSTAALQPSLPIYSFVFLLGALSALAVVKWKRWGVYGLTATWVITAIVNAIFSQPVHPPTYALGIVLIIAFFWQVRRIWPLLD